MAPPNIPPVEAFEATGENQGEKWAKWVKAFGSYMAAMQITEPEAKLGFLLHTAGPAVQDIYENFNFVDAAGAQVEPTYQLAMTKLDEHFAPQRNVSFERHVFHKVRQREEESVDDFITRLRKMVKYCEYGVETDANIRDQFIEGCWDPKLRSTLLKKNNLTLTDLISRANRLKLQATAQPRWRRTTVVLATSNT